MLNLVQHLLKGSSNHNSLFYPTSAAAFIQIIIRYSIRQTLKQVQGDGSGKIERGSYDEKYK